MNIFCIASITEPSRTALHLKSLDTEYSLKRRWRWTQVKTRYIVHDCPHDHLPDGNMLKTQKQKFSKYLLLSGEWRIQMHCWDARFLMSEVTDFTGRKKLWRYDRDTFIHSKLEKMDKIFLFLWAIPDNICHGKVFFVTNETTRNTFIYTTGMTTKIVSYDSPLYALVGDSRS